MGKNRYTNKVNTQNKQAGFGVFGAIVIVFIGTCFIMFGLSAVPIYRDHLTIMKIAEDLAVSEGIENKSPRTIKRSIAKLFHANNLGDMDSNEILQLHKIPGKGLVLVVDYEARRPLVYNMDLVARFEEEPIGLN